MHQSVRKIGVLLLCTGACLFVESAMIKPNPIISRGTGVVVKASAGEVTAINDNKFGVYATTRWTISDESWVAIKVVAGTYAKVFMIWNCPDTSWTDSIALAKDSCKNSVNYPVEYELLTSANSTDGKDGDWTSAVSVTNNNVCARGHLVDFTGASWIKMHIVKGKGNIDEIEVFDATNGAEDTWFFLGTKFTALMFKGKMNSGWTSRDKNVPDSNFAALISRRNPTFTPAVIRGGTYCRVTSGDVVRDLSKYFAVAGNVHFWAIELGTYDAWGGKADSAAAFKKNLEIIIDSCRAHGIEPIINRTIGTNKTKAGWQVHNDFLAAVDDLVKTKKLIAGPDLYAYFTSQYGAMDLDNGGVLPNDYGDFEAQREWNLKMDTVVYKAPPVAVTVPAKGAALRVPSFRSITSHNGKLVLDANGAGTVTIYATSGQMIQRVTIDHAGTRSIVLRQPGCYLVTFRSETNDAFVQTVHFLR